MTTDDAVPDVPPDPPAAWFEHNVFVDGEDWRTAHLTCLVCGATVTLSRTTDTVALHKGWHQLRMEHPPGVVVTADLEAVTRELLRVIPCEVFNAPATCLWSCEERTCDSCQKVAKLTAVLASLPDDRLAEAEAKAWDACAEWCYYDGLFDMTTLTERVESANPYRASLSGGDAP